MIAHTAQREFYKLWAGQSVSLLGSEVSQLAMPLLAVLVLGASPGEMGILRAVFFLPELLGLPVGVLVDRSFRRPLLIGADLVRAVLLGSIPLAAALGVLAMPQVYVVTVLTGAASVVFGVAYVAYLRDLVPGPCLLQANSRLELSRSSAHGTGPAVAGALVQGLSAAAAILFDALSFLVSGICLWWIREPESMPRASSGRPMWSDILDGLRRFRQPVLRATTLASATWNFFSGGILDAIYVLYLSRELHLAPAQIATLFTLAGLTGIIGALLAMRVARRIGLGVALIGACAVSALMTLVLPFCSGPPEQVLVQLCVVTVLICLSMPMVSVGLNTLRQAFSPPELMGRVSAGTRFVLIGVVPLGALLGGALGDAIGPRGALIVAGLGVLGTPLWPKP